MMPLQPPRLFLDTEFTHFPATQEEWADRPPQLISLALVTEDGDKQFYVEVLGYDKSRSCEHTRKVVEPQLDPIAHGKTPLEAALALAKFIGKLPEPEAGWKVHQYVITADLTLDWALLLNLTGGILPATLAPEPGVLGADLIAYVTCDAMASGVKQINRVCKSAQAMFKAAFQDYCLRNDLTLHHALHDARGYAAAWRRALAWSKIEIARELQKQSKKPGPDETPVTAESK